MGVNVDAMVREAISAIKGGKKEEGRQLLLKAVELDQYSDEAWLWLSGVVETEEEQRICLENVLQINPSNEKAKKGLQHLNKSSLQEPTILDTSLAAPPAPTPSAESTPSQPAATESSVEWEAPAVETSSPSSYRPVNEPTPDEYDDWVAGLGLSGEEEVNAGAGGVFTESPFDDGPFSSTEPDLETTGIDYDPFDEPPSDDFDTTFDTDSAGSSLAAQMAAAPPAEDVDFDFDFDDDAVSGGALYGSDDMDGSAGVDDPQEYFRQIPDDIKATTLPGDPQKSGASPVTLIGVIVLVLLNVGAVVALALNFM